MTHHEFSPSRLDRIKICPGSWKMEKGLPEAAPSPFAEEGTLLHERTATGNLEGLTEEQKAAVRSCIEFRDKLHKEYTEKTGRPAKIYNEQKVTVHDEEGNILTEGTADTIIVSEESKLAVVSDWKYGFTPVKEVSYNLQLAAYAAGVMESCGVDEVECHVFQPRIFAHSHYTFSKREAIIANVKAIIAAAKADAMILNPTDESCRYCKARLNCPAFRLKYQRFTACAQTIDINNPDSVSQAYAEAESVQKFIKTLEEKVREFIERDGRCGQYGFKVTDGNRMIADINKCYERVKDYVTLGEFNTVCTLAVGKFETLIAGKMKASAEAMGEKLTVAESKKKAIGLVEDLVTRGTPTKRIVKLEE